MTTTFANPDNLPPPPRSLVMRLSHGFAQVAHALKHAENMGDVKGAGCHAFDLTHELEQLITEYAVRRRLQAHWRRPVGPLMPEAATVLRHEVRPDV